MSKNSGKNNFWWIILLLLLFAPSLLKKVVRAALILIPLAVVAVIILVIVLSRKSEKKSDAKEKSASSAAQESAAEPQKKSENIGNSAKNLKHFSRSGGYIALAVLLYAAGAVCGLAAAIYAVVGNGNLLPMIVITLWLIGCGGIFHLIAHQRRKRARDAARYAALIGERDSFSLAKLSSAASYKIDRVRSDLQRMIDRGIFGDQAYIDMANLCFMRTPDAQPDAVCEYSRTMYTASSANDSSAEEADTGIIDSDSAAILAKIRALDEEIRDESVSERIRKIEAVTKNIFDYISDKPEKRAQIRMFMNYYLPTTLKLLESYSRIERVGVAGQNMQEAKDNIEKILDMLVTGFEQQFDQLYGAESLDITSDIEVLEQMMKKDGLSGAADFVIRNE